MTEMIRDDPTIYSVAIQLVLYWGQTTVGAIHSSRITFIPIEKHFSRWEDSDRPHCAHKHLPRVISNKKEIVFIVKEH
jgi:hypothetical protein